MIESTDLVLPAVARPNLPDECQTIVLTAE
jgi:hypothetical protein